MKILAIDTSNQTLSIALLDNQEKIASSSSSASKNHSVTLMPAVKKMLTEHNVSPKELGRIVVAQGPGSYTGLRIGVTTAKTLAWTLNSELVGVSSLAHLASTIKAENTLIVPLFDARRNNVYAGGYQWQNGQLVNQLPDCHISLEELLKNISQTDVAHVYFVGELSENLLEIIQNSELKNYQIDTTTVLDGVNLGRLSFQEQPVEDIKGFVPTYLKLVEAEEKWLETHSDTRDNYVEKI